MRHSTSSNSSQRSYPMCQRIRLSRQLLNIESQPHVNEGLSRGWATWARQVRDHLAHLSNHLVTLAAANARGPPQSCSLIRHGART